MKPLKNRLKRTRLDEVEEILECSPLECLPLGRLLGLRASLGSAKAEHSKTIRKAKVVKILRLDTP